MSQFHRSPNLDNLTLSVNHFQSFNAIFKCLGIVIIIFCVGVCCSVCVWFVSGCFSVVDCITLQYTNTLLCHFSSDFLILFCLIFQSCTNVPLRDCAHSSFQEKFWRYKEEKGGYSRGGRKVIFFSDVCLSILWSVMITWSYCRSAKEILHIPYHSISLSYPMITL